MPTPKPRSVAEIKSKLLNPSLTSHFEVEIPIPPGLKSEDGKKYLEANGLEQFENNNQSTLNLLCSETSLPGSNIGTMDITGDYHGVTVRHANRRIYDDRIDMTFYVDAENYLPIKYFEVWMKYIVGESITETGGRPGSIDPQYFYRLNYPKNYIATGLAVTKFERTGNNSKEGGSYNGNSLKYQFINSFPISIASMPVSYDASSLLKCTISFSYIRYVFTNSKGEPKHEDSVVSGQTNVSGDPSSPINQAAFNNVQFNPNLYGYGEDTFGFDYGKYSTTGGVNYSTALASGNSINATTAFNPNTTLS